MEDQVISVETAVLAKEKGFNVPVRSMYLYSSTLYLDKNTKGNYNDPKWVSSWRSSPTHDTLSAPTQSLLQRWLREKYNIDIVIKKHFNVYNVMEVTMYDSNEDLNVPFLKEDISWNDHSSYEEALEDALQEVLELIESK